MEFLYVNGGGETEEQAKEAAALLKRRMRLPSDPVVIFCPNVKETAVLGEGPDAAVQLLGRDLQSGFPAPFHLPFPQVGSPVHADSARVLEVVRSILAKAPKGQIVIHAHGAGATVVNGALSYLTPVQLANVNLRIYGGAQLMSRPTNVKSSMQFFHEADLPAGLSVPEVVAAPDLKALFTALKSKGLSPAAQSNLALLYLSQKDAAIAKFLGGIQVKPGKDHGITAYIDTVYPK